MLCKGAGGALSGWYCQGVVLSRVVVLSSGGGCCPGGLYCPGKVVLSRGGAVWEWCCGWVVLSRGDGTVQKEGVVLSRGVLSITGSDIITPLNKMTDRQV